MRSIAIALIVIGIVGLVLSAILPLLFGYVGIVGSIVGIVTGIGFMRLCRCGCN